MTNPLRVLMVEDNPADSRLVLHELRQAGFNIVAERVDTEADYLAQLDQDPDIVLSDYNLPQFDAMEALALLLERKRNIPFIIVSGSIGEEIAVNAMRQGATDFLLKDRLGRLGQAVKHALEQKRLREQRRQADRRQAILLAVSHALAKAQTLSEAATKVLQAICDSSGWQCGGAWAVDTSATVLRCVETWTAPTTSCPEFEAVTRKITFSPGVGLPGRVWVSGKPTWIRDIGADLNFPRAAAAAKEGLRGGLGFPILIGNKVSGVFDFFSHEIVQPDEDLLRMFAGIGEQVGQFVERMDAEEDLRQRGRLQALAADVGVSLINADGLRNMLQACTESLVRHLGAAFARIWTLNESEGILELQASAGMYSHIDGPHGRVPVGKFKIGLIAQERAPHLTNDVQNDPRVGDHEWARREGMVAFAGYPLLVDNRLVGVMAMFARQPLQHDTLDAMAAVGNNIALGIQRKEAEGRLEHVLSTSPAVLYTLAIAGGELRPTWISENVQTMLGYAVEDVLLPNWWHERVHPEDLQSALAAIEHRLFTEGRLAEEYRFRHRDGHYLWVRGEMRLLRDPTGKPMEVVGSWSDVTERKRAETERNELLQRLKVQIERMPLAYLLFDADLRVIDWNSSAERIFGFTKQEILGMGPPFEKITPAAFKPKAEELYQRIRSGDMSAHSVNDNLTKDGRIITCEWSNTPSFGEDGQFSGLLSLAQDVTQRKTLEEQFRQAQKMEAVGKLAGGVAHDFNNLLTIINGYSGIMLESLRPADPLRDFVEQIQKAGERAAGLTRQLLAFSRKQILQPTTLNVNTLLVEMEKMLGRLIGEDIALTVRKEPDLWLVKADAGQLEQVVMNLVINARDAMAEGGKIAIDTTNVELDAVYTSTDPEAHPGEHILIRVTDTGCGMDSATQARIFEPFFTTKGEKGTGLGLATVFGIVKQSGGHIGVYSKPGLGTVFEIYLPREWETATSSQSPLGSKPTLQGKETVLLVEDEEGVRVLARVVLKKHGYKVLEARHGGEALLICEQHKDPIHILVTDVVMPNMSGRQLAERLLPLRPEMKVMYVSGYTDDAIVRHGILDTKTPFLQKPFNPTALAQKIREVLDTHTASMHH